MTGVSGVPAQVTVQTAGVQGPPGPTGPQGETGPDGPGFATRWGQITWAIPSNMTIPLISYAPYAFPITGFGGLKVGAGGLTASIQINGVDIPGLGEIAVTSDPQNPAATGEITVNIGDRVTLVISGVANASMLEGTLY